MRAAIEVFVITAIVVSASFAHADTVLHGPFSFTNGIPFELPQFSSDSGYLRSTTFTVTNCSLGMSIIVDNDSTNSVHLTANIIDYFALYQDFRLGVLEGRIYSSLFSAETPVGGTFSATNDGDGFSVRDGGEDELTFDVLHTNIGSRSIWTSAFDLARCTDQGVLAVTVDQGFQFHYSSPLSAMPLDIFTTNMVLVGEIYVQYDYESTPLAPKISGFCVTNGMLEVEINNLSVASSNILQRCFDLRSNEWFDVQSFVSGYPVAIRTLANSNQYGNVFYRVLSR